MIDFTAFDDSTSLVKLRGKKKGNIHSPIVAFYCLYFLLARNGSLIILKKGNAIIAHVEAYQFLY